MQLYHEYSSVMHTNTYFAIEGGRAFVVDPGDEACADSIKSKLGALRARLEAVIITHAHFDHIAGVAKLCRLFEEDEPKIYMHKTGANFIKSDKNLGKYMGVRVEPFVPDVLLEGGEKLHIAGKEIEVIHTPGHSVDGVCYKVEDRIFTGDTLFFCTYGRTDLYGGNFAELKRSALKLFALEGNFVLLPGHGEPTTLEFERRNNPILNDDEVEACGEDGEDETADSGEDSGSDEPGEPVGDADKKSDGEA